MRFLTSLYLLYLLTPIILLFVGSFGETWVNELLPTGITLRWYLDLWDDPSFSRAFWVSLKVCFATCSLVTVLALPMAYALYMGRSAYLKTITRVISLLPIAAPPLVLGFGFILLFSTDTLPWLGSTWLLIAGHVVLTLPYMLQTLVSDFRHLGIGQLESASESLGATWWQGFYQIVVPCLRHSLATGLIMVAALSIGEFQLSNLIAGFLNRNYPVVLLQAFYGATGFACAATVALLLLATLAACAGSVTSAMAHAQLGGQSKGR
ncbi:ABC transporter permease [Dethiosulfatarculus sandiegensis]|uniref:ABC transporter permease n=1 Tax=Dethiosulfatarculus sandiegensis TaxID=1429043 RepID=A0A0D2JBE3_9BACT|nr:ABC transporter permease subunit [Dethiosulfatarculus sandiegensis]KIX13031.1 ABC transporter permease [Dethiosulfatarculus sandiegensis]